MRKTVWTLLGIVLLGTSAVWAQNTCGILPCDRADCNPCDPCGSPCLTLEKTEDGSALHFGRGDRKTTIEFGGWIETGIYTNSHGWNDNGPMHCASNRRTDFLMNQLYLFGEKKMDAAHGFDWGARADLVYGVDGPGMQSYGDETFDYDWGVNRDGYGMAAYQLYATVGYKNLSVKYGKFITPIGWEAAASKNNFFYSHSYCYWIEPSTHVGALADYAVNDRLTFSAGWTAGHDIGFANRYDDNAVLAGVTWKVTRKATIYYWLNGGRERNDLNKGAWRFADENQKSNEYYVQSLCLEWMPTDRFTYIMQYNLRNDNAIGRNGAGVLGRTSSYGINNHLIYKINDRWAAGLRLEWLRDNGGYIVDEPGNYWEVTLGLNWSPVKNLSIRPEVRYDGVSDGSARPFAGGTKRDQVSGGFAMLYSF